MRQITQFHLLLQMPQTTRIVLDALSAMRFDFVGLLVAVCCLLVLYYFHVRLAHIGQHPARVVVLWGQLVKLLDCLLALVGVEVVAPVCEFL